MQNYSETPQRYPGRQILNVSVRRGRGGVADDSNFRHEEIRTADQQSTARLVMCLFMVYATGKERGPHLLADPQAKGCTSQGGERGGHAT